MQNSGHRLRYGKQYSSAVNCSDHAVSNLEDDDLRAVKVCSRPKEIEMKFAYQY
jgi:hypothetical protein